MITVTVVYHLLKVRIYNTFKLIFYQLNAFLATKKHTHKTMGSSLQ